MRRARRWSRTFESHHRPPIPDRGVSDRSRPPGDLVGAPALIYLAQSALFWIVVGGTIAYNELTGRP